MELVKAGFILDPKADEHGECHSDCQAANINKGEAFLAEDISPGDFEKVFKHKKFFLAPLRLCENSPLAKAQSLILTPERIKSLHMVFIRFGLRFEDCIPACAIVILPDYRIRSFEIWNHRN